MGRMRKSNEKEKSREILGRKNSKFCRKKLESNNPIVPMDILASKKLLFMSKTRVTPRALGGIAGDGVCRGRALGVRVVVFTKKIVRVGGRGATLSKTMNVSVPRKGPVPRTFWLLDKLDKMGQLAPADFDGYNFS